jgi:hypothetical protein
VDFFFFYNGSHLVSSSEQSDIFYRLWVLFRFEKNNYLGDSHFKIYLIVLNYLQDDYRLF